MSKLTLRRIIREMVKNEIKNCDKICYPELLNTKKESTDIVYKSKLDQLKKLQKSKNPNKAQIKQLKKSIAILSRGLNK